MKKIIYTSFDEGKNNRTSVWRSCEKSVRAWASRCGAEIVNLPKPTEYQPQWVIFDAFRDSLGRVGDYKFCWIDCDILVQDTATDLFSNLPSGIHFCQPDPPQRIHPRMRRNWKRYGIENPRPYVVSALGFWGAEEVRSLVSWFDSELSNSENPRFSKADGDQELLTVALQETNSSWNYLPPHTHKMSAHVKSTTPFMHAAGKRKKRKIAKFKKISKYND